MFGRWLTWGRAWLRVITPHAIATAVFLCGVVLLFSGATPIMDERLHLLREIVPPQLLEASHLLGKRAGVALLFLAQSLQRRLDAAWHVTLWLLIVGAMASLAKGFDYEEALILLAMVVLLVVVRDRFHRKASLLDQRFLARVGGGGDRGAGCFLSAWPCSRIATSTYRRSCGGSSRWMPTRRARCAPHC